MNFRLIFISLIASLGILMPQAKSAEEFLDLQCLSDINTKSIINKISRPIKTFGFDENSGRFVKNDGSPNIDQFAEWLSNRWKEFAPYDSDNMSHSNIRKKLSLASKFFKKPSEVTDKS